MIVQLVHTVHQGTNVPEFEKSWSWPQMRDDEECAGICEALVEQGADVNATTRRGHTALIFAAGRGRTAIVRSLLALGANPRVMTVTGAQPQKKCAPCSLRGVYVGRNGARRPHGGGHGEGEAG